MNGYQTRERLKDVFRDLRKDGFIARINYMCCNTCAQYSLFSKIEKKWKETGKIPKGVIYWHQQEDKAFKEENGGVYISYIPSDTYEMEQQGVKPPLTTKEVGKELCKVLKRHGLHYLWNGDPSIKIEVIWGSEDYINERITKFVENME